MLHASDIIARVRDLTVDNGQRKQHWENSEIYNWLKDAQDRIIAQRPYASALHGYQHRCTVGSPQRLHDTIAMILNVGFVTDGDTTQALYPIDRRDADAGTPGWVSERGTPEEYILVEGDKGDPRHFWLLPGPNNLTTVLDLDVAVAPNTITSPADELVVSDEWGYTLVDYCMYRMLSKHNKAGNAEPAMAYYRSFLDSIGQRRSKIEKPPEYEQHPREANIK